MIRKNTIVMASAVLAFSMLGSGPALAHHSFAMFDSKKAVIIEGTVREFQWTNPHCWIQLTVKVGGKNVDYSIEGQSPNSLTRLGWARNVFKAGDKVKIKIHPLRDGSSGGAFISATFANGRVLMGEIK